MTRTALARALLLAVAVLAASVSAARAAERASLAYRVAADPAANAFHVGVRVEGAAEPAVDLRMPSWQPASYALQPYADAASHVEARDDRGVPLRVTKPDRSTWRVEAGGHPFTLAYDLDLSDRQKLYSKSYCYATAGAVQAGGTLPYLPTHRDAPVRVTLDAPEAWQVATPLEGSGRTFAAADYDELVDSPILFGDLRRVDFAVRGIPFSLVYDARLPFDEAALASELARTAEVEIDMFGSAPFDKYLFLYLLTPDPSGNGDESLAVGIEHARSTLITIDPVLASAPTGLREVLAETDAHELFHAWNVKAIRPAELDRPDYAEAPRVRSLWMLEGVTSYYADRVVAAVSAEREAAGRQLRSELGTAVSLPPQGRPIEQVGVDVPRAGLESMVAIYVRGEGLGLLLDLEVRAATANRAGLDDVMRTLYERSRRGAQPYREDELPAVFSKVAGRDMSEFFRRYVAGAETPPVERILGAAAWRLGGSAARTLVDDPHATPLQQQIRASILSVRSP
jgi:predicted metalloprotease with PDZ domain